VRDNCRWTREREMLFIALKNAANENRFSALHKLYDTNDFFPNSGKLVAVTLVNCSESDAGMRSERCDYSVCCVLLGGLQKTLDIGGKRLEETQQRVEHVIRYLRGVKQMDRSASCSCPPRRDRPIERVNERVDTSPAECRTRSSVGEGVEATRVQLSLFSSKNACASS
jgi:hypothetical protein